MLFLRFLQIGMENELIPKADVQAQVELLQSHLKQLRTVVPSNKIYLIAEANMSCRIALLAIYCHHVLINIFFYKGVQASHFAHLVSLSKNIHSAHTYID